MGLGAAHRSRPEQAGASLTAARDPVHKARENLRQGLGLHPSSARSMQSRATLTMSSDFFDGFFGFSSVFMPSAMTIHR